MSSVMYPFQHFLELIISDEMEKHDGMVSKSDRNITNLRFADDIYDPSEEEQKLRRPH